MTKKNESTFINTTSVDNTFRYTNETFSGCDMVATITFNSKVLDPSTGNYISKPYTRVIGEMTTVSYSIHMEKKPVRSIGNVNAKDYIMGPRTIAGSLVFSVFNRHFAHDIMNFIRDEYSSGTAYLVDELPPFDLTISAANEYGYRSRLAIYGIRLLNEGQVMSINDVYTENTYQFFATDVEYLNDEMKYVRDSETGMYKLKDDITIKDKEEYVPIKADGPMWTEEQQKAYEKFMDRNIKIIELVKHPSRENTPGIVRFSIDPPQDEGVMHIEDSKGEVSKITLQVQPQLGDDNRSRSISTSLYPDTYIAYFENTRSKVKSNKVRFKVNRFVVKKDIDNYTPIIENITDTRIDVFANEPSHDKVALLQENELDIVFDIIKRRCSITDLDSNKSYTIYTFNSKDGISSPSVTVKTLGQKDKMFEELILFCYANSRHLAYPSMAQYVELINEAKKECEESNANISDSISVVKLKYVELYRDSNDDKDKEQLTIKIFMCNELLDFAVKLNNDFIKAINDSIDVPMPKMTLNSKYENVFEFDEKITAAEFYKQYKYISQLYYDVPGYNFKNIDGVENSFRFNGKPGLKHFVEAKIGKARSPKLEFYVMTQVEKEQLIAKDEIRNKLTDKDIDNINTQITKDQITILETNDYKRTFMINAKKSSDSILLPPEIETINDNILVRPAINQIICDEFNSEFFLAIATYENILCDDPVYKVRFTNLEDVVAITKLHHGLEENKVYAIWIEDYNGTQLSNASTIVYSNEFDLDDDNIKEYEIKDIIEDILTMAKNNLSTDVFNDIKSVLENNKTLANFNIVKEVLTLLMSGKATSYTITKFLKEFKKYIGIKHLSDSTILTDVKYSNGICNFNSSKNGTIVMINSTPEYTNSYISRLNEINSINTNVYNDLILIVAIDENLKDKSSLILINTREQSMEVL